MKSPQEHLELAENEIKQGSHAPIHRKQLYVAAAQVHATIALAQIELMKLNPAKAAPSEEPPISNYTV